MCAIAGARIRIYPPKHTKDAPAKIVALLENPDYMKVLRSRLSNLSWFMKTLQEPIAKRANAEDGVKGRFFEGRFKSQILLSQNAILAAMAYVDLNPVRAKIVASLGKSKNTGINPRMKKLAKNQGLAHEFLAPIAGLGRFSYQS